jgi:hypothetical protein
MVLVNANIKKENVVASSQLPGYSNFYLANCPGGILNVPTYKNVLVKNVYPGIDWNIYTGEQNKMEYDFIVHPGADPKQIRITYKGAQELVPNEKSLQLISSCGSFTEGDLLSYEKESGRNIPSAYKMKGNEISFALGNYDRSKTIVIDPPLQWSSLQTGSGTEYAYAIALSKDGTGHTVLTGYTDSPDFPTLNAYQGTLSGPEDMVIVRLDGSGNRVWSTYYGGTNIDGGKGIGTDLGGNAYVCGYTGSSNFPTLNPAQASYGGGTYDIVALKLNASGVRQWATYYGGVGTDYGNALCSDDNGNIYMTGYTASNNFPLVNAISTGSGQATDAFVMKMKPGGTVRWSDFFGNIDDDRGRAITLNSTGTSVYFTGSSLSSTLPGVSGSFQPSNASAFNAEDVFISKWDTSGQTVNFTSFCGGTDADFGQGIAVDGSGKIFVTGYTLSSDFPIKNPGGAAYVDSVIGSFGTHDAFVMACNSTGTTLLWGTYYGGSGVDLGIAITYNPTNGIFVTGSAGSTDFTVMQPMDNVFYQSVQGDGGSFTDMFIGWFYTNYSLQWSTYYGGAGGDEGRGICNDAAGNIYVAGTSNTDAIALKFAQGVVNSVQEKINTDDLLLYPQPAGHALTVNGGSWCVNAQLEIYDAVGNKVNAMRMKGAQTTLDVSSLAPGTYFVKIVSGEKQVTKKFVKF